MAWIMSHQELARHPKTRRLARALDETIPSVIGRLHLLWWWCLDYAQDGDLARYDNADIADATLWDGDPDELFDKLVQSGFIDADRKVHDWDEYAGRLLDQRQANANKQRAWRERHSNRHEPDTTEERNGYVTVTKPLRTGATGQDRTGQDSTESRTCIAPETPKSEPTPKPPNGAAQAPPGSKPASLAPVKPAKPEKPPSPRSDQAMWSSLARAIGNAPDTPSGRGAWNSSIKQLLGAGVTADQIPALVASYRQRWPGIDVTPTALAKHLHLINAPPEPSAGGRLVDRSQLADTDRQDRVAWMYSQNPGLKEADDARATR